MRRLMGLVFVGAFLILFGASAFVGQLQVRTVAMSQVGTNTLPANGPGSPGPF